MKHLKIKVCGMKFPQNIVEVAALNPDFLGFIFYPLSKRHVNEEAFKVEITNSKKIGVFVNQPLDYITEQIEKYKLDGVQLHGDENAAFAKELKTKTIVLKALQIDEDFNFSTLEEYNFCVDYFLFDTKTKKEERGGTGKKFDWNLLILYKLDIPFFLSGGITLNDVEDIKKINHQKLEGVDINSGFEEYPGFKNSTNIKMFINQIRDNEK
ncbi:MAG: phosphoribosylanthranilate isomerase [Solirubrobacteraceae bacterium]